MRKKRARDHIILVAIHRYGKAVDCDRDLSVAPSEFNWGAAPWYVPRTH